MRRIQFAIAGAFVVAILFILIATSGGGPKIPRYVPGAPASMGAITWDHYNWITHAPFEGGKVWVWTVGSAKTNRHVWLFDLDRRAIAGELFDGGCPELWSPGTSRILCQGPDAAGISLRQKVIDFVGSLSGRKPNRRTETFWILDLSNNVATRLGAVEQFAGSGSSWVSSPGFRYGYTAPTTMTGSYFVLCDLKEKTFAKVPLQGTLKGWWDERTILTKTTANTFELFDVVERKSRSLFGPSDIEKFLLTAGITNSAGGLDALANWNGRSYDFYFGPEGKLRNGGSEIFLFKLDRGGPSLNLLFKSFMTQWGGHLDADGTHYLYQGESGAPGKGGNGAVYLRNLTNDQVVTVVPPDNSKQYAIPRFYGNEVIYFRNRVLHRIGLDGNNDALLVPSPGKQ